MEERLYAILEATVKEFIRSGEPVSSSQLYDRYDFGIHPAMIRLELHELTRRGLLEQPHHSAGRVPSDRGIEYFTHVVLKEEESPSLGSREAGIVALFKKSVWPDLIEEFSGGFGVLGAVDDIARDVVYKNGLSDLVSQLTAASAGELREIVEDFERLEERVTEARGLMGEKGDIAVFVGKRSPVTKSKHLSVVAKKCAQDDERVVLYAIGPRFMNYQKVIGAFKKLQEA